MKKANIVYLMCMLQVLDVNLLLRKAATVSTPQLEVSNLDGKTIVQKKSIVLQMYTLVYTVEKNPFFLIFSNFDYCLLYVNCLLQVFEEGGVWNIKTSTTLKTMELKFKVIYKSILVTRERQLRT